MTFLTQAIDKLIFESVIDFPANRLSSRDLWRFIAHAKWPTDHDYDRIREEAMDQYTPEQLEELERQYRRVVDTLKDKIDDVTGVSDDGFEYLASYIVGIGEHAYQKAMADPSFAQRLVDENQYKEGFSYVFPDKSDWKTRQNSAKNA